MSQKYLILISTFIFSCQSFGALSFEDFHDDLTRDGSLPTNYEFSVDMNLNCLSQVQNTFNNPIITQGLKEMDIVGFSSSQDFDYAFTWTSAKRYQWETLVQLVNSTPCLNNIEPEFDFTLSSAMKGTKFSQQKHHNFLKTKAAWNIFRTIPGVLNKRPILAVIDTGVDIDHNEFKDRLWINFKEKNGTPGKDDDGNGYVDDIYGYNFKNNTANPRPILDPSKNNHHHGTHVAGLAAADGNNTQGISGIHPQARVMSLNIFGNKNTAKLSLVKNAVRYAYKNGAHVINMSLTAPTESDSLYKMVRRATKAGSTVVVAAGNYGRKLTKTADDCKDFFSCTFDIPASWSYKLPGQLTVGSYDLTLNSLSNFSNYSNQIVSLLAPGSGGPKTTQGIYSTFANNSYGKISGTSMASPIAAGAALWVYAAYFAKNKKPSSKQVVNWLKNTALKRKDLIDKSQKGQVLDLKKLATSLKNL